MVMSSSYDSRLRKPLPKTLMLKDYLRDDLSSCSSTGFRSCPRRQCCTTVRFLLEIDLKSTRDSNHKNGLLKSKMDSTTAMSSAFQRASKAVINAVKLLPFAAAKSPSSSPKQRKTKSSFLPRNLSRKLRKRSFWKRTAKEIEPQKSFKYFPDEKEKPSVSTSTTASSAAATATDSNSSTSESNSNSWSDSEFNSDYLQFSSGNSESSCADNVAEGKKNLPENTVSKRMGVIVGEDSIEAATTTTTPAANSKGREREDKWPGEEEKEQYSPVSVLDFPFHDGEEVSSPFQSKLSHAGGGTKHKLMHKIRRFESLADQLEPMDLDKKQFSLSEFMDESSLESPIQGNLMVKEEEEDDGNETERKANDLFELLKATISPLKSIKFKANNLLLDLLRETLKRGNKFEYELLLNEARDWMNGQPHQMLLGWEVQNNRQEYVRDMEKGGRWDWDESDEYKDEVAVELEDGIFASLVDELLLDFNFHSFQI